MRLNTSPHEHGFTMVEMIVVMLIIAVLTAVAVPMYLNQRNEAHAAALKSDLHSVSQAVAASRAEVKHGFKEPVNINNVAANSIDPDTQIPVRLSKGITLQYEADDDNFCIVGTHESDPTNVWSYSTMRGSVEAYNCITGESSGSDEDGTVVAAPEPTIPVVVPTTTPTTAPTVAPTTTPTTTPTTAPTTTPTTTPTVAPTTAPTTPAPSNPRLVEHTATHTTGGMILKGKVADVTGDITLRASASELTGQLGWYLPATPDSNGNFEIELTKFTDNNERFWQLELGDGGSNYGTKLASGTVSPTANTTDPAVVSYTVRYTSNGATISAVIKNHNGKSLIFRTSASPIVSQVGTFQLTQVDYNGNFTREVTGYNHKDSNRYWQLEVGTSGSVHGPVLAKGHVTASNPTNTGP